MLKVCLLFIYLHIADAKVCSKQILVKRWRVVNEFSPDRTYSCEYNNDSRRLCEERVKTHQQTKRQSFTVFETKYFCCPGYYEDAYGNCKGCPAGRYGMGCKHQCACPDRAYELCNHENGSCTCLSGWTGSTCQSTCQPGTFGEGCVQSCSCPQNAYHTCHHVTGKCTCKPGWQGENCEEACQSGFFGENCLSECSCPPTAFPNCDHETGRCRCLDGWIGPECDQQCVSGYFGENCQNRCACQNGGSCDHVTGACQCVAGWYGTHCQIPCPEGKYGQNCQLKCDCLDAVSCSPVDGTCKCLPGIKGVKCDEGCSPWTYGSTCSSLCTCDRNTTVVCSPLDGTCLCLFGWTGERCHIQVEALTEHKDEVEKNVSGFAIGLAGVFVLVAGSCLVMLIAIRKHRMYSGCCCPFKIGLCRSMLSNTVVLETNENVSSLSQDNTRLCSAEVGISHIADVESFSLQTHSSVMTCDDYDSLRRDINVKVSGRCSRKPYDHVTRQVHAVSAPLPEEQTYDVTEKQQQNRRPNSNYQSLIV